MPHYEFICRDCHKGFLQTLSQEDYEEGKNRKQREPRLMALADWGLRNLLLRAQALGATEPEQYLLPLQFPRD
jgi:hypothetical protein